MTARAARNTRNAWNAQNAQNARNTLIGIGAYYCSQWLAIGVELVLRRVGNEVGARDYFLHALVRPFVMSATEALAAAACGISVALLVDSPHPARWTLIPAALLFLAAANDAWLGAPSWNTLLGQVIVALLPAFVCVAAGRAAVWHRGAPAADGARNADERE